MKNLPRFLILLLITFSFTFSASANVLDNSGVQDGMSEFDPSYFNQFNDIKKTAEATSQYLNPGEIYFLGKSPDNVGHGVGLSQWGAFGAAQKNWNAHQILKLYYSNVEIENRNIPTIDVKGYGVMPMNDYVAGLGEVPDKACGTQAQINSWKTYADSQNWAQDDPKRSKYVLDNSNAIFDCWPEETIKAQVIAARTYASVSPKPICTDDHCQVYKGGKGKAWAAYETNDQYIISKGNTGTNNPITAFYSSNNSNGMGTADNDTNWSDKAGNGTPYSYLRSAIDKDINFDFGINRKTWQTNSYRIVDIDNMLFWCSTACASKDWVKTNIVNVIGTLKSVSTTTDTSGRVKKVIFSGTKGSASAAGWFYAQMFNAWQNAMNKTDYVQSVTFTINVVPTVDPSSKVVYRLWNKSNNQHMYTMDANEKTFLTTTPFLPWQVEDNGFYAYLTTECTDRKPAFRFRSLINSAHFFTLSQSEADFIKTSLSKEWVQEADAFCAFDTKVSVDVSPIYRFWDFNTSSHFFTPNEYEKDYIVQNLSKQFRFEGIGFYAYK